MKKVIGGVLVLLVIGVIIFQVLAGRKSSVTPVFTADPATERMTTTGKVIGYAEDNTSQAWLGIPYAKAPVGALRWKAPAPTANWEGTYQALKIGPVCTQIGGPLGNVPKELFNKPVGSEDCLYLNIWSPRFTPESIPQGSDRLPVMFWIHGGGNSIGHGGGYSGKVLAATYRVIVVTINYRLGPFGWFNHPALNTGKVTAEDASGNYGMMDCIQALTWVQENIAQFGGDPKNVTVFGESAGGRNTMMLLLSPKAKGLFHRAIVQSGSDRTTTVERASNYSDDQVVGHKSSSREIVNRLLIADRKASSREEAKILQNGMSQEAIAAFLYQKSNFELLDVYQDRVAGMLTFPQVFGEGTVLPAFGSDQAFQNAATYNAVPVILGTNRDEYKLFMAQNPDFVKIYLGLLPVIHDKKEYNLVAEYLSTAWKISSVDEVADSLAAIQGPSVYAYRFDWDEEPSRLGFDISLLLGAAHGFEIPFVFNDPQVGFSTRYTDSADNLAGRKVLSAAMSSYWAEFAYSGSPGKGRNGNQIEWAPWNSSSPASNRQMVFDSPNDQGIRLSPSTVTLADLKNRLVADTGFTNQKTHCKVYVDLFGNPDGFFGDKNLWSSDEYSKLGKEGCKDYPKENILK